MVENEWSADRSLRNALQLSSPLRISNASALREHVAPASDSIGSLPCRADLAAGGGLSDELSDDKLAAMALLNSASSLLRAASRVAEASAASRRLASNALA
eukprot:CAMPEP_0195636898 /NCGR_PEP_ID=MMETSP0815-20121206/24118_1 /TAXON_ID=97485 /ORGANISM="Prymnesium parvum, Strain Texoma1" /LENGTH=100 /DNA_ID=CAMNT_0040779045 /DNA_START=330 /DNA_END=629 /DNA_ORIENTATION=-